MRSENKTYYSVTHSACSVTLSNVLSLLSNTQSRTQLSHTQSVTHSACSVTLSHVLSSVTHSARLVALSLLSHTTQSRTQAAHEKDQHVTLPRSFFRLISKTPCTWRRFQATPILSSTYCQSRSRM